MTTLVITNDFPPRLGGIESFVAQACGFLDDDVVVLTSSTRGRLSAERACDAALPYPVVRRGGVLLPTLSTLRAARALVRQHGCDRVLFGAAAPLGLLARALRTEIPGRVVAISHGHEVWWSGAPVTRHLLRRIARDVDVLTAISGFTQGRLEAALPPPLRDRVVRLAPPVDLDRFTPGPHPSGPPTIVSAGRFVPRKNQATLLRAFTRVRDQLPDARLRLAGAGPGEARLRRLAGPGVEFVGRLEGKDLTAFYRSGHVFALPVARRPRDQEGFGMVFAEAAACGLPVVVGNSGGAPETCRDGVTGHVVEPDDVDALAARLVELLSDPDRARAMGEAGRAHVEQFSAQRARATLRSCLQIV